MTRKSPMVMLVAGEASGDRYAAELFQDLKQRMPGISAFGMGGEKMKKAGVDIRYDSTNIAVIGVGETFRHFFEIKRVLKNMTRLACQHRPDLLICVDYKEFNFRLARAAKACGIKVLFYVSPQLWAWRPGRVTKYGEAVDMMAVIFPFEVELYEAHDIPVRFVGHPLVGQVHGSMSKAESFQRFHLDPEKYVVGLFPGSRNNEIKRLIPLMVGTASLLSKRHENIQFVLSCADSVSDEVVTKILQAAPIKIRVIKGQPYDLLQCCNVVMIASGTATLEAALMGVPMTITYKVTPLTYWLGKLLIEIPFIGLPNILAGRQIVHEFVQDRAIPSLMSEELHRILTDEGYRKNMVSELDRIKATLGHAEGTSKLAELAVEMLAG